MFVVSESLYSMLSKLLLDDEIVKSATKKARNKIKKSYDENVRKKMIQYYLDSYKPKKYKRQEPSPLFLAYKTRSVLGNGGMTVDLWVENTGIDLTDFYHSNSYYHDDGDKWESMTDLHSLSGKQYMLNIESLHDEHGSGHGAVQGSWILKNFEAGIHPTTNGWPRKKWSRRMKYIEKRSQFTPLEKLESYAEEFQNMDMQKQYIYNQILNEWNKRLN